MPSTPRPQPNAVPPRRPARGSLAEGADIGRRFAWGCVLATALAAALVAVLSIVSPRAGAYLASWCAEVAGAAPLVLLVMAAMGGSSVLVYRAGRQCCAHARAAVAQAKRYQALLLAAGDGICVLDRDGRIVEANEAFGEMLASSRAELLGTPLAQWELQPAGPERLQRLGEARPGQREAVPTQFRRTDGGVIDVELISVACQIDDEALLYCSARDITQRRLAEEALRASQAFLLRTGRVAGVGGWEIDLGSGRLTWSDETRHIHGVDERYEPTLALWLSFYPEPFRAEIEAAVQQGLQAGTPWDLELPFVAADGRACWVRTMGETEHEQGRPLRMVGAIQDITERKQLEHALRDLSATLHAVLESIPASVAVAGVDHRCRFVNQAFERWYGCTKQQVVGRPLAEVIGEAEYEWCRPWIDRVLAGESVSFERLAPAGSPGSHLSLSMVPLRLENGGIDGFIGVAHDVTPQKHEQVRLLELAMRDSLTGLLNRAGFDSRMRDALTQTAAEGAASIALLCIDLDHFKALNDDHGHSVGDEVLRQFGQRLSKLVRPTDAVARLGGDEFAIVLEGMRDGRHAHGVATKIVDASQLPYRVGELELTLGASVGVAYSTPGNDSWRELFVQADAMLYRAKKLGRGRHAGACPDAVIVPSFDRESP